jgi:hypothetical protein
MTKSQFRDKMLAAALAIGQDSVPHRRLFKNEPLPGKELFRRNQVVIVEMPSGAIWSWTLDPRDTYEAKGDLEHEETCRKENAESPFCLPGTRAAIERLLNGKAA